VIVLVAAIYFSGRVSAGSLIGALFLPPAAWFTTHDPAVCAATLGIMVLILIRHKENIQRLATGAEPIIRFSRRKT
jgi:glycerol-3-phosphate acyltransferase PlsY